VKPDFTFRRVNTILYCQKWAETVTFYQNDLELPLVFATDWLVEFYLGGTAYLSVADEQRATLKSAQGTGITISLQVDNADEVWAYLHHKGFKLTPVKNHTWGARVFYFFDPEGHRLEIWSPIKKT
jgi:catechol 2,3-dioxygenase-like lactoylglutathione lyase family enzyme